LDVPVTVHLLVACATVLGAVLWATGTFLPVAADDHDRDGGLSPFAAWRELRTVLIGLFVLTMAFTEGTGNDWLGVAAIDGYGASAALGSLAYVLFVASMTLGRWFGPTVLDRHGRVPVLRTSAACSLVGLLIVVFGPNLLTAMVGTVLWGVGVALGFPVGMSAAADEPRFAAGRVSVVATIGYVAFLAGPAVIGVIGDHVGVLRALTVTAGLLSVGLLLAGATRTLAPPDPT
jgi:predicted MFS family arabinose efflux permease